jgi:hypothetical protein
MAEIPPWLNVGPTNFLQATAEGSNTGLRAGEIANQAREFNARQEMARQQMAMEQTNAVRRQQIADVQQAQNFQLSNAEMQMRRDIATQNNQRMQAQQQMLNAYRQAQVGLGQDRLKEQQELHEAKARDAALAYRDEQGFSDAIASGASPEQALFHFPRTRASIFSALTRTGTEQGREDLVKWKLQATAAYQNLKKAEDDISSFNEKSYGEEEVPQALQDRLAEARSRVQELASEPALQPPAAATPAVQKPQNMIEQKIAKANELRKSHPDWSKDKVIEEVNKLITEDKTSQ